MALAKKLAWSPRVLRDTEQTAETGYIAVAELHVDPAYQRVLDESHVQGTIVDRYDPRQMEPLTVSRRSDGAYYVLDGQHRLEALKRLGIAVALCVIHSGMNPEEEATLFLRLNSDRRAMNQWAKFRARMYAREPIAIAISKIVEEVGLRTGTPDRSIGRIAAVKALERIYNSDPQLLRFVLTKAAALWPADIRAYDGVFLTGLAMFTHSWSDQVDWSRFDAVFGQTPAVEIAQAARRLCKEVGYAMGPTVIALAIRDLYNGKSNRVRGRVVGSPVSLIARRKAGYVKPR